MPRPVLAPLVALALLWLPAMVRADLTADLVWQNWQQIGAASGQTFAPGEIRRDGPVLTLSDVAIAASGPDIRLTGVIPWIELRENGDGSVSVAMPDRYDLFMERAPQAGPSGSMTLMVEQHAVSLRAHGTPEALVHDFTSERFSVHGRDLVVDGEPGAGHWSINVEGLNHTYDVKPGAMMALTLTSAARSADISMSAPESTDDKASFEASLRLTGLAGATNAQFSPDAPDIGETTFEYLAAGGNADVSLTFDTGSIRASATDFEGQNTVLSGTSDGGHLRASLDTHRLTYDIGTRGARMRVAGMRSDALGGFPVPEMVLALDEAGMSLRYPMKQAEEAQDFALGLRMRGVDLPEALWSMLDPEAMLPRDPATVILDAVGKLRPLVDPLDPLGAPLRGPPVELHALALREVQLAIAGAELTGKGAMTFDHSQPPMLFGLAPMPQGRVELSLTGATTLLGKLMELGLVDTSLAMGFGIATAMFARPGEGPDSFVSEIESRPDGLYANGQPLPFGP
ncbi:MAG: DUF2125 domain-containing protein [Pseudorhodobacter sp.]